MGEQIPAAEAVFRRMPDEMIDVLATSPDSTPPRKGGAPVWLQVEAEGGGLGVVIVACPAADDELWVIAPAERGGRACRHRGGSNCI
jgi:hypothetical protein